MQEKNATHKIYHHNKDNPDLIYRLQFLQERLSTSIEFSKESYYARIANRLSKTQKKHQSLLVFVKNLFKHPAYTTIISQKSFYN